MTAGFNCDRVHQALHALSLVLASAKARTGVEIELAMISDPLPAEVVRHASPAINRGDLSLVELTDVRIEAGYSLDQPRAYYSPGIAVRRDV